MVTVGSITVLNHTISLHLNVSECSVLISAYIYRVDRKSMPIGLLTRSPRESKRVSFQIKKGGASSWSVSSGVQVSVECLRNPHCKLVSFNCLDDNPFCFKQMKCKFDVDSRNICEGTPACKSGPEYILCRG